MNVSCARCGAEFSRPPSAVKKGARFCSQRCSQKSRETKHLIPRSCERCGIKFKARRCAIQRGGGRFCSVTCKNLSSRKTPKALTCETCQLTFYRLPHALARGGGRFCSTACRNIAMAQTIYFEPNTGAKNHNWKPPHHVVCANCRKNFYVKGYILRSGRRFCSQACWLTTQKVSRPVIEIKTALETNGIRVEMERQWDWLRRPNVTQRLRVDMYLPELRIAIEYDGRQHREEVPHFSCSLAKRQERDRWKEQLLAAHRIRLIRLSGWPDTKRLLRMIDRMSKERPAPLFNVP